VKAMRAARHSLGAAPSRMRGFGLVETMVALAVGLLVLGAALGIVAASVAEARRTALEARLMQDLRASTETMVRVLRRAGFTGAAADAVGAGRVTPNPYGAFGVQAGVASLRFSRDATENGLVDGNEQFGLRLRAGVVELQLGSAGWQAMTDASTLFVTTLQLTPTVVETAVQPGPCGARHRARRIDLVVEGRAAQAPSVVRRLATRVALRNDLVVDPCTP